MTPRYGTTYSDAFEINSDPFGPAATQRYTPSASPAPPGVSGASPTTGNYSKLMAAGSAARFVPAAMNWWSRFTRKHEPWELAPEDLDPDAAWAAGREVYADRDRRLAKHRDETSLLADLLGGSQRAYANLLNPYDPAGLAAADAYDRQTAANARAGIVPMLTTGSTQAKMLDDPGAELRRATRQAAGVKRLFGVTGERTQVTADQDRVMRQMAQLGIDWQKGYLDAEEWRRYLNWKNQTARATDTVEELMADDRAAAELWSSGTDLGIKGGMAFFGGGI